jgi:hypothetical protein
LNDAAHLRALLTGLLRRIGTRAVPRTLLPPDRLFVMVSPG